MASSRKTHSSGSFPGLLSSRVISLFPIESLENRCWNHMPRYTQTDWKTFGTTNGAANRAANWSYVRTNSTTNRTTFRATNSTTNRTTFRATDSTPNRTTFDSTTYWRSDRAAQWTTYGPTFRPTNSTADTTTNSTTHWTDTATFRTTKRTTNYRFVNNIQYIPRFCKQPSEQPSEQPTEQPISTSQFLLKMSWHLNLIGQSNPRTKSTFPYGNCEPGEDFHIWIHQETLMASSFLKKWDVVY